MLPNDPQDSPPPPPIGALRTLIVFRVELELCESCGRATPDVGRLLVTVANGEPFHVCEDCLP